MIDADVHAEARMMAKIFPTEEKSFRAGEADCANYYHFLHSVEFSKFIFFIFAGAMLILVISTQKARSAESGWAWLLAIQEKTLDPNHPEIALSLNNLGLSYIKEGRYAEAEPLLTRAVAIRESALGTHHPHVAISLSNLGNLYVAQGRFEDAEAPQKSALEIFKNTLGAEHPNVAIALNNLASSYISMARYVEAEDLLDQTLSLRERVLGQDHPGVAIALNNLAYLREIQGHYNESESLYRRTIEIYNKTLWAENADFATALNNLALSVFRQGRHDEAEHLWKRALEIRERKLGSDHPDFAMSLNNLGHFYDTQGRPTDAEALFRRALEIFKKSLRAEHPSVATTLNNLALLYERQNRYADAERSIREALSIRERAMGPNHPDVAMALSNLALIYIKQGRYADADPLLNRAILISENSYGSNIANVATMLNNVGALYSAEGRYADAESLLKRALEIKNNLVGPDHSDIVDTLDNLIILHSRQHRYGDSVSQIRRRVASVVPARSFLLLPLFDSWHRGHIDISESLFLSLKIIQTANYSSTSDAVNKLTQRFAAGSGEQVALIRRDQDLANQWTAMDKLLTTQFSKPPEQRNKGAERNIRARIDAIVAERKEIAETLAKRFPDYVALTKPPVLQVADIQAVLEDDEALVAIEPGEKSFAWVVTRTTADWTEIPVSAATLNEEVQALREGLTAGTDGKTLKPFDTALAFKVYQQTLGPIANMIAGKKRLSVYLGGALTSIPLQVLVTADPAGKKYADVAWLTKSFAITNLPSIYSLKAMRRQLPPSRATKPMIAFADPVFSPNARTQAQAALTRGMADFYQGTALDLTKLGQELAQLPGTRREVMQVGLSLNADPKDQFLGVAASAAAVRQAKLDQYRVVYFATHALVAGDIAKYAKAKTEPGLALSFPAHPTQDDNGLLFASDIAQLKLDADWVVLSACNTAAGNAPGAEALSGLARAFIYAGARSLLVSHWQVDDAATAKLMTRLFEIGRKNPGMSHAEMLQEAMLLVLKTARTNDDAHPRLWAPFVVVGEPQKPSQVTGTRR